jgi:hypothetical protein
VATGEDKVLPLLWLGQTVQTLRGVIWACEGGYSRAADGQVRSLFEDLLVGHWMAANPSTATERRDEHFMHSQLRHSGRLDIYGTEFERPNISDLTEEQVAALKARFGDPAKGWQGPWHGLTEGQLLEAAIEQLDPEEAVEYRRFAELVRGGLHLRVHSSPAGLNATVFEALQRAAPDGSLEVTDLMCPSTALVLASLANANWAAGHLLRLLFDMLGLEDPPGFEGLIAQYRSNRP